MRIGILYITNNRLELTKISLPKMLSTPSKNLDIYIWDNASNDGTVDYLKTIKDEKIKNIFFSDVNVGLNKPVQMLWNDIDADIVGKIDNDIYVSSGWLDLLVDVLQSPVQFGAVSGWHLYRDWEDVGWVEVKKTQDCITYIPTKNVGGCYLIKREHVAGHAPKGGSSGGPSGHLIGRSNETLIEITSKKNLINAYIVGVKFLHLISKDDYYKKIRNDNIEGYLKWESSFSPEQSILHQIAFLQNVYEEKYGEEK